MLFVKYFCSFLTLILCVSFPRLDIECESTKIVAVVVIIVVVVVVDDDSSPCNRLKTNRQF